MFSTVPEVAVKNAKVVPVVITPAQTILIQIIKFFFFGVNFPKNSCFFD
jgi:hypothetical protein